MSLTDKGANGPIEEDTVFEGAELASLRAECERLRAGEKVMANEAARETERADGLGEEVERLTKERDAAREGERALSDQRDAVQTSLQETLAAIDEARAELVKAEKESAERLQALATATEIAREFERRMTEAKERLVERGPYGDVYKKKLIWDGDEPVTQKQYADLVAECARLRAEAESAEARGFAAGVEAAARCVRALRPSTATGPAPSPAEDVRPGAVYLTGRDAPCYRTHSAMGVECTRCGASADLRAPMDAPLRSPASDAPAPAATGLPKEGPGDEDDLPESALCATCSGSGIAPDSGPWESVCGTCGGSGRSPSPTGGAK